MIKIQTPFRIKNLVIYENGNFDYDVDIEITLNFNLKHILIEPKNYIAFKYDNRNENLYIMNKDVSAVYNIYKYSVKNGKAFLVDYY